MNVRPRIIPVLLLKDGGLYKTTKFKKPSYVGDPINTVKIFNAKEVDELIVLDIEASREGRPPDFATAEALAEECFMPLCWGGGIRDAGDAAQLFRLGVEKVSLQTAALGDLSLITQLANRHGSQAVIVSIDVTKDWLGRHKLHNPVRKDSREWTAFARQAVDAGAGEVLLTSVDREGTLSGLDIDLVSKAAAIIDVPLIAHGGASNLGDAKAAIDAGASAVAAGAWFVWQGPHKAVLITYPAASDIKATWGN